MRSYVVTFAIIGKKVIPHHPTYMHHFRLICKHYTPKGS